MQTTQQTSHMPVGRSRFVGRGCMATVDSLTGGTTRRQVPAEWRHRRPGRSAKRGRNFLSSDHASKLSLQAFFLPLTNGHLARSDDISDTQVTNVDLTQVIGYWHSTVVWASVCLWRCALWLNDKSYSESTGIWTSVEIFIFYNFWSTFSGIISARYTLLHNHRRFEAFTVLADVR